VEDIVSIVQSLRVGFVLGMLAASSGCIVNTTPDDSPGSVSIEWTINGSIDPNYCTLSSAALLRVTVYDARGASAGTYDSPCTNFGMVVDLPPGTYSADALFVDAGGKARTTTAKLAPFTLYRNRVTSVPADFPTNSFF
jgi:hypothetical protein